MSSRAARQPGDHLADADLVARAERPGERVHVLGQVARLAEVDVPEHGGNGCGFGGSTFSGSGGGGGRFRIKRATWQPSPSPAARFRSLTPESGRFGSPLRPPPARKCLRSRLPAAWHASRHAFERGHRPSQSSRGARADTATWPLPSSPSRAPPIEALNRSIEQFDEELEKLAAGDELAKRLQTVPGVGVVTSLRYMATLDVASRFRNGAAVGSYVGLVPSEHSSGQSQRKGGITKAGSPSVRSVLVQAAWAAMRSRRHYNDPMGCWARAIARRRGKKIAVVALARKLAGILFAMWRDGTQYNALRAAAASAELPAAPRRPAPSKGPRRPLRLEPAAM